MACGSGRVMCPDTFTPRYAETVTENELNVSANILAQHVTQASPCQHGQPHGTTAILGGWIGENKAKKIYKFYEGPDWGGAFGTGGL